MTHPTSSTADSTSVSLIRRVVARDEEAWHRLTQIYGPLVYRWIRRFGVPADRVSDVSQEVFQVVLIKVHSFRREKKHDSFRGWLYGITRIKTMDHFRRQGKEPQAIGGTSMKLRAGQLADDDEDSTLYTTDADDRVLAVRAALDLIRPEFSEKNFQAFWRTAIQEQAATEVAADLGMKANAVRQAKFRILKRLRRELEELEQVGETTGGMPSDEQK